VGRFFEIQCSDNGEDANSTLRVGAHYHI